MLFLEMLTKNSPSKTKKFLAYMDDPPLIVQLQEQIKAKQANEKKARESQGILLLFLDYLYVFLLHKEVR